MRLDAATHGIASLGALELLLAIRMSAVNMEQMKVPMRFCRVLTTKSGPVHSSTIQSMHQCLQF